MRRLRIGALLFALLCLAPAPGDIGSCGQDVAELDPVKFFIEKQAIDCTRCLQCNIVNQTCDEACEVRTEQDSFPPFCFPLVHDGEVCLNALKAASCEEFVTYVDDVAPTIPTECNFCPVDSQPVVTSTTGGMGGASAASTGNSGAGGGFGAAPSVGGGQ